MGRPLTPLWKRFEEKVEKTSGCWLWTGNVDKDGYGRIREGGMNESRRAHRVAYALAHGSTPVGKVVMHSCDNRLCVNPAHLKVGSIKDNNDDRIAKGRTARGPQMSSAKLNEDIVRDIRKMEFMRGDQIKLADELGVSPGLISMVKRGKVWSWVQ